MDYERLEPILIRFFGALFPTDTLVKNNFNINLVRIQSNQFKELLTKLLSFNIDSFYPVIKPSPVYKYMN